MGPLISCSSVDGKGLDLVKQMLHTLNQNNQWAWGESLPFEFEIDDIWQISVGCIVGGTISSGSISAGDTAWLGPDREGNFVRVQVSSIQFHQEAYPLVTQPGLARTEKETSYEYKCLQYIFGDSRPNLHQADNQCLYFFVQWTTTTYHQPRYDLECSLSKIPK